MKTIEVKDLTYSYDGEEKAVNHVSFSIEAGSYTTIIGHNGSGKSTIAKLLINLLVRDEGTILLDGLLLNEENEYAIRDKVGIVFQNPDNQFIGSSVADDIAFGLENHQVPQNQMEEIIQKFAKQVNMSKYLQSEPTRLSGGQKQRVAIAGVLAMSPEIIIFDEATSMLDPQGKEEINKLIQTIHDVSNLTIISITHDIEEVAKSDYVLVMDQGHIVMQGVPDEILQRERELINLKLDIPFALKFCKALHTYGVDVPPCTTLERAVDEVCQLHLKK